MVAYFDHFPLGKVDTHYEHLEKLSEHTQIIGSGDAHTILAVVCESHRLLAKIDDGERQKLDFVFGRAGEFLAKLLYVSGLVPRVACWSEGRRPQHATLRVPGRWGQGTAASAQRGDWSCSCRFQHLSGVQKVAPSSASSSPSPSRHILIPRTRSIDPI